MMVGSYVLVWDKKSQSHSTNQGNPHGLGEARSNKYAHWILSQSHSTNQGNYHIACGGRAISRKSSSLNPTVRIRAIPSRADFEDAMGFNSSQSHNTDQVNPVPPPNVSFKETPSARHSTPKFRHLQSRYSFEMVRLECPEKGKI